VLPTERDETMDTYSPVIQNWIFRANEMGVRPDTLHLLLPVLTDLLREAMDDEFEWSLEDDVEDAYASVCSADGECTVSADELVEHVFTEVTTSGRAADLSSGEIELMGKNMMRELEHKTADDFRPAGR